MLFSSTDQCYYADKVYNPQTDNDRVLAFIHTVLSAAKCQEYCQNTVGCAKYSYFTENFEDDGIFKPKDCVLMNDRPMRMIAELGAVSGPKICPGLCVSNRKLFRCSKNGNMNLKVWE